MASFPQTSPSTPCAHLYPPPYAPHALPISIVSILPPAQYWVRSTDHSAPRYAAFAIPLLPKILLNGILPSLFQSPKKKDAFKKGCPRILFIFVHAPRLTYYNYLYNK